MMGLASAGPLRSPGRGSPVRVAVVGAGIVGVSTAEWLRRDGHEVTLIDRARPGEPGQASFGNAGVLAASSVVPVSVPGLVWKLPGYLLSRDAPLHLHWGSLARSMPWLLRFLWNGRRTQVEQIAKALAPLIGDTVEQHLALARGTEAASYVRSANYTAIFRDRAAFRKDAFLFGLRRSLGSDWDEWDRATLNAHEPELSDAYGFAASFRDHGFISSPAGYVAALAEHFEREGGRFLTGEAVDIVPCESGGAAVTLSDGARQHADRMVLAAGVWSAGLARRLGYKTAMVAERGYHVMLSGASYMPRGPIMVADAKTSVTPMADGLRFAGTVEVAPVNAPPSRAPVQALRRTVRRVFPRLSWQSETTWMGQRPSTVDSLPLIGPLPDAPAVLFAFGSQHVGMTMGPRMGRLIADLVAMRRPNIDLHPYRVDRFNRG